MLDYTKIDPRRSAWGGGLSAASASNFSYVALNNTSQIGRYLVVRDFAISLVTAMDVHLSIAQQTFPGTVQVSFPLVPIDRQPAGAIVASNQAATIASGYNYQMAANLNVFWPHDFPFALLPAGWSIIAIGNTVNQSIFTNYWWTE